MIKNKGLNYYTKKLGELTPCETWTIDGL